MLHTKYYICFKHHDTQLLCKALVFVDLAQQLVAAVAQTVEIYGVMRDGKG